MKNKLPIHNGKESLSNTFTLEQKDFKKKVSHYISSYIHHTVFEKKKKKITEAFANLSFSGNKLKNILKSRKIH